MVKKGATQIEFSSLELKKRNQRFNHVVDEVLIRANTVLAGLFNKVIKKIAVFYQAAESVDLVDLLASFADIASKNEYTRPEFGRC